MKKLLVLTAAVATILVGCGTDGPEISGIDVNDDAAMYDANMPEDTTGIDLAPWRDTGLTGDDAQTPADATQDAQTPLDVSGMDSHSTDQGGQDFDTNAPDDNGGATDLSVSWDATPPNCDEEGITCIFLQNDHILVNGPGAVANEAIVTINAAGTYSISGTLDDGQIQVDTADSDLVKLMFNGMQASSSTSSPLYVVQANNVEIFLVAGTMNSLTDATTYVYETVGVDEPNAALFCTADLDITGLGVLNVTGRYNDAINVKDGLDILGGTIIANGADDGIRGKDNVSILGGSVTVGATNNGIKSDNETDTDRGFIDIQAGTVKVTSGGDGLTAARGITISGGSVQTITGGGSGVTVADSVSAKGIKGLGSVVITGGTINVDSADDGVHSDGAITINGGTFTISSADDGMHGEESLTIGGGDITITKSYEGLESKEITINNGTIHLTSSDDGVNVAGGDGSGGWSPGGGTTTNYFLYINGGYLWMNAGGDGLDSNGNIVMTGGTVLVNGPTDNGNGPIDIGDGSGNYFKISGGYLVAAGSSGMAVGNSTTSTQYGVLINLTSSQTAGTVFHLQTATGADRLTFKPAKKYQSVFFSSPEMGTGSHVVYLNGSSSGTLTDNLYTGGTYTPGTQYTTFSVSSVSTRVGSGGGPGGP